MQERDVIGAPREGVIGVPREGVIAVEEEILFRCIDDPFFFFENFVHLPDDPEKTLKLYPKQRKLVELFLHDHYVVVNSSRQVGKTTVVAALILWLVLFFPGYKVAIVSRDADHVKDILRDNVMAMYELLPEEFKVPLDVDNKTEKVFKNGSIIKGFAVPSSNPSKVGRGVRAGFVFIDEAAFIPHVDEVYTALAPVLSSISQIYKKRGYPYGIIVTSTPNGRKGTGEWFYRLWVDAISGRSIFKPLFIHWRDAGKTEEWAKEEQKKYSRIKWLQEFEGQFIGSEDSFVSPELQEELFDVQNRAKALYAPLKVQNRFFFTLYKEPYAGAVELLKAGHTLSSKVEGKGQVYLMGVDTAGETGRSEQAVVLAVYDYERGSLEFIGEGHGKLTHGDFKNVVDELAKRVVGNRLVIFAERNYFGQDLISDLIKRDPRFYSGKFYASIYGLDKGKKERGLKRLGIVTNKDTRPLMFESLEKFLEENRGRLLEAMPLPDTAGQIQALEYGPKGDVRSPTNDDLVMAANFILYPYYYETEPFMRKVGYFLRADAFNLAEKERGKPFATTFDGLLQGAYGSLF